MTTTLRALIRLSFLEFIRDRIVWIGCFIAVLLFALTLILGNLSFNEQQRILAHLGWSVIELSTLGISLVLSANWLHKEMQNQTCLLVLARPVSRTQFLLGKYLAIFILTLFLQIILAFFLWVLLGFTFSFLTFSEVFWGTFLEVAMVSSICFLIATVMRPSLAFFLGLGTYLIGHWIQEIEFFGQKYKLEFYQNLAKAAKWLFPNLFQFNWRSVYFLENGIPVDQVLWCTFHALGWLLFAIFASILVFRRKDLV